MKIILRVILFLNLVITSAFAENKLLSVEQQIQAKEPKEEILVFVSFSMHDSAIKKYYEEIKNLGGRLIIRGLINDNIMQTKEKIEQLEIDVDIDPVLFEDYAVVVVPTIVQIKNKVAKKIAGHISLVEALKLMDRKLCATAQ